MKIREYIKSGILEVYVLGSATEAEKNELLALKKMHPEIEEALYQLETDVERMAKSMAVPPPPALWERIEGDINALEKTDTVSPLNGYAGNGHQRQQFNSAQFIEVEGSSSHMRIHKLWRWVFAAVFVLGKIFLACAIYYYLENRQMVQIIEQQNRELMKYR